MLYPLKFEPVYKEKIWGGNMLHIFLNREIPSDKIGESWELSDREDGMSYVSNGYLRGKSLRDLILEYQSQLLGTTIVNRYRLNCPLLFKFIDADDKLSVQVHPDDIYAQNHNEPNGKEEFWYILYAKKNAKVIYGLKEGLAKEDIEAAVKDGRIGQILKEVYVNEGDFLWIPAGTVHAILDGLFVAEIQQNSDTTYRLYDWDRKNAQGESRTLHINQALEVIKNPPETDTKPCIKDAAMEKGPAIKEFQTDKIKINSKYSDTSNPSGYSVYMVLDGEGQILYDNGSEPIRRGDTVMIPAALGSYVMEGNLSCLKTYFRKDRLFHE